MSDPSLTGRTAAPAAGPRAAIDATGADPRRRLPSITLLTPNRNQAAFLGEAIESVLRQDYPALEYGVLDGKSDDGSVAVLERYGDRLAWWVSEPDRGQSDALIKGFRRARGEVLGWLNADDVLEPGALLRVGRAFAEDERRQVVVGGGAIVGADAKTCEERIPGGAYAVRDLMRYFDGRYLPQPAVFFRREAYLACGGLDASLHYAMDLDLWLRMAARTEIHAIDAPLARLRRHAGAKTYAANEAAMREVREVLRRHWHVLGPSERRRVASRARHVIAGSACARGMHEYFEGDLPAARRAFLRALREWPGVCATRAGSGLLARLVLPSCVKRRLFRRP